MTLVSMGEHGRACYSQLGEMPVEVAFQPYKFSCSLRAVQVSFAGTAYVLHPSTDVAKSNISSLPNVTSDYFFPVTDHCGRRLGSSRTKRWASKPRVPIGGSGVDFVVTVRQSSSKGCSLLDAGLAPHRLLPALPREFLSKYSRRRAFSWAGPAAPVHGGGRNVHA
jgi:hypothetical protein